MELKSIMETPTNAEIDIAAVRKTDSFMGQIYASLSVLLMSNLRLLAAGNAEANKPTATAAPASIHSEGNKANWLRL